MISSLRINKIRNLRYPCLILSLQLALLGILGLNELGIQIPIARQFLSFVYLTFVPGVLILKILKLEKLAILEKFVLSVGLSISFIMFFGLLINSILPIFGYLQPLSTRSIFITFCIAVLVLLFIPYVRRNETKLHRARKREKHSHLNFKMPPEGKFFLAVPMLFPALSLYGTHIMNLEHNNICLMLLLILIPIYLIFISFFHRKMPDKIYPIIIFLISISLSSMLALRSNHIIIGTDTGRELLFFRTTLDNLHWSLQFNSTLDASLSITLLPTIYKSLSGAEAEFLLKILPLLFSISPLAVYSLARKYMGGSHAFLASIFFMSQITFLHPWSVRVILGILFCALAIMVLFKDDINEVSRRLLFVAFCGSIIISHYSSCYIFFFILLFTYVGNKISHILILSKEKSVGFSIQGYIPSQMEAKKKGMSLVFILLFFMMLFVWYSQITAIPFNSGVQFMERSFQSLNYFFLAESRGQNVEGLIGKGFNYNISSVTGFISIWASFILIIFGILSMLCRRGDVLTIFGTEKPNFRSLQARFELEYLMMGIVCGILLLASISVPSISYGYGIERLYQMTAIILSPFFILGGISLSLLLQYVYIYTIRRFSNLFLYSININKINSIMPKHILIPSFCVILLVLVPYNLYMTGVLAQISGVPNAVTLNSPNISGEIPSLVNSMRKFIHDEDVYSAEWLDKYGAKDRIIYTNDYGAEVLMGEGKIRDSSISILLVPTYEKYGSTSGYIYLRWPEVMSKQMVVYYPATAGKSDRIEQHNLSEYPGLLAQNGEIYNNGGSEIFK